MKSIVREHSHKVKLWVKEGHSKTSLHNRMELVLKVSCSSKWEDKVEVQLVVNTMLNSSRRIQLMLICTTTR